jgi:hypothetical protein
VISGALPVFAADPMAAAPLPSTDSVQGASLVETFADLLVAAEATAEGAAVQTSNMGAQKAVSSVLPEELMDEEVRPNDAQDRPVDVAALAYALITSIPMEAAAVQEAVKIESAAVKSVPGSPTSPSELHPVMEAVTAVGEDQASASAADRSQADGSPLYSCDSGQTPATRILPEGTEHASQLRGKPPTHTDLVGLTPVKQPAPSTPLTAAQGVETTISGDAFVVERPPTMNVSETAAPPVVLEARIVPKPKHEMRTEAAPAESVDAGTTKEALVPAQESAQTHSGNPEDDREKGSPEPPSQRVHVPSVRPEVLVAEPVPTRVSNSRIEGHEPLRQPHVTIDDKSDTVVQPAPLKHLDIRIPDANGGVTVRVQERAGAVQVSVRTSDTQIAGNIADTLPDLTRQLDQQGFQAETWTPAKQTSLLSEHGHDASPQSDASHGQPVHAEQTRDDNQTKDDQRRPEWQEQPRRRPKTATVENFKEHLT